MALVLSEETKKKISTDNAPMPQPNPNPNIGKPAFIREGTYKNLMGIIYPIDEGIRYYGSFETFYEGQSAKSNFAYLLMYFFKDGSFFCAVGVKLKDVTIIGGGSVTMPGSGTVGDPYSCAGKEAQVYIPTTNNKVSTDRYHVLPYMAGEVFVYSSASYSTTPPQYRTTVKIQVFFADNMNVPIVNSEYQTGNSVGEIMHRFYFDPQYNVNAIVVRISKDTHDGSPASNSYSLTCPKPVK